MRRVILLGLGSRGDVAPLVRLGAAMRREGHEVTVVTSDDHQDTVRAAELSFVSCAPGMRIEQSPELADESRRSRFETSLGTVLTLRNIMRTLAEPLADVLDELVTPDHLFVTGVLGASLSAALRRARHCDAVNVTFAATVPTAYGGSYISALLPGRVSRLNRGNALAAQRGFLSLTSAPGRELACHLGQRLTVTDVTREFTVAPTLVGTSPLLAPRAPDWPEWVCVTGAWAASQSDQQPPLPRDLEAFLADGPPPVYVGFGSAVSRDPAGDLVLFAEAARDAGVRVVARRSDWLVADSTSLGPHAHVIGTVSHDLLLARTAAVIHHGGAGTTVAALRAGVPSSVIWHNVDQPFHARRSAQLGVGPLGFGKRQLTRQRLAELMKALVASPDTAGYQAAAEKVSAQIAHEDGTKLALVTLRRWKLL